MLTWKNKRKPLFFEYYRDDLFTITEKYILDGNEENPNLLIYSDVINALCFLIKNNFRNKIGFVYLDPPFQKQKNFFSNHDDKKRLEYKDIWHTSEYLQFIYDVLYLVKILMSNKSTLYFHIDEDRSAHIRLILDEIFGEENRLREIIYNTSRNISGFKSRANNWIKQHETIFMYKTDEKPTFHKQFTPWNSREKKKFSYVDENGRKYKTYKKNGKEIKQYLDEIPGIPVGDIWNDIDTFQFSYLAKKESLGYPTQKPEALLKRMIDASTDQDYLCLDCFCGSGTTASVCEKKGLRWISIDKNPRSIKLTIQRIKRIRGQKNSSLKSICVPEKQRNLKLVKIS